jgi:hypothetical protein
MEQIASIDNLQKNGMYELSKLLQELKIFKKTATDERLRRDYDIYVRDIQRFLKKASHEILPLEEFQVYIDDYQGVIQNAKVSNEPE